MSNTFDKSPGRVRVEIDGVTVADSADVVALHEGGLPIRYYFPKADVRFEYLQPTDTTTRCGWKGNARYWSARVGDQLHRDILWGYDDPLPGAVDIAGLVSFYNDRVDITVG